MEEVPFFIWAWRSGVFGDSGTIEYLRHELEASTIAVFLTDKAGFDTNAGVLNYPKDRLDLVYCRDEVTRKSLVVARERGM